MYKVKISAMDGQPITPRTGKSECIAITSSLPKNDYYQHFIYYHEDCESPGVAIYIKNLECINDEFLLCDYGKRQFKVKIIEKLEN